MRGRALNRVRFAMIVGAWLAIIALAIAGCAEMQQEASSLERSPPSVVVRWHWAF